MTLANELWQANQDLAQACLNHPFVQGIGSGTLPKHKFAYYVGQDAFFLEAFGRAYSIAAARSPDMKGFELFHNLASGAIAELNLHQAYAAEWGVDLTQVTPSVATRRYTDFLLSTAWANNSDLTAVAMAPCMHLYLFLGQQLAAGGIPQHPYTQWIETYSGQEFQPLVEQLEGFINQSAQDISIAHSMVSSTYRYAMICERDFFQAAWEFES